MDTLKQQHDQSFGYLPIAINCRHRQCLVVGGGSIAKPKVGLLLRAGAGVSVVAPRLCGELKQQAGKARITHIRSHFEPHLLSNDIALVVAAAEQRSENQQVAQAARERNIPVNVVDMPDLCSFTFPAIVDRAPLTVAISTAGHSPMLASLLRQHLEAILPAHLGELALFAGQLRRVVKAFLPNAASRRRFWEAVLRGNIAKHILQGNPHPPLAQFNAALNEFIALPSAGGIAWLTVAAEDPELLTLKALRVLQQSDMIVHDAGVARSVLAMARRDADRIDLGDPSRNADQTPMVQGLIRLARNGKRVCRISRCDPYALSDSRKELFALLESGVPCELIPGVSEGRGDMRGEGQNYTASDGILPASLTPPPPHRAGHQPVPLVFRG